MAANYKEPLHQYAAQGDIDSFEKLWKKGKNDINEVSPSNNRQTPLHVAAYEGKFNMVYWLLTHGADVKAKDFGGWTALHAAACNLHLNICSLLLTRGADPNATNEQCNTALHYIIRGTYSEEFLEVLNLLIANGVDLESKNKYGETPLFQAASKGMTESVRFLLDHHANPNTQDKFGQTPLHKAVEIGNIVVVVLLLRYGADESVASFDPKITPLDIAKKEKKQDIEDILTYKVLNSSTYTFLQGGKGAFTRSETMLLRVAEESFHTSLSTSTKSNQLLDDVYYTKNMPRQTAELLLEKCAESTSSLHDKSFIPSNFRGVFLVRDSSQTGRYALSLWDTLKKRVFHLLIEKDEKGGYRLTDSGDSTSYEFVSDLVAQTPELHGFVPIGKYPSYTSQTVQFETKKDGSDTGFYGLSSEDGPIINAADGFHIEQGFKTPDPSVRLNIPAHNYKNWYYHSEHHCYYGTVTRKGNAERYEPLVLAILPKPNFYCVTIFTRLGDQEYHYTSPASEGGKMPKWKNGVPSDLKKFIEQKINEIRKVSTETPLQFNLEYKPSNDLRDKLLEFEINDPLRPRCFCVGVLYAKKGQVTEMDNFNNEHGSELFEEFLQFLGDKIPLRGWLGYRGDLDLKDNSTGKYSIYRRWKGFEIMFHVSTYLPYTREGGDQQVARKRRIGNDIGVIVFQEGGEYSPPIKSNVLHSYFVVSPLKKDKETHYKLAVCSKDKVPAFGPQLPEKPIFKRNAIFKEYFFTKVLNGILASLTHPALRESLWCKPKEAFLADMIKDLSKSKSILSGLEASTK